MLKLPNKIPITGACRKCGHNAGFLLKHCLGSSRFVQERRCNTEGEHIHRICTVCSYDEPKDPVDLAEKVIRATEL